MHPKSKRTGPLQPMSKISAYDGALFEYKCMHLFLSVYSNSFNTEHIYVNGITLYLDGDRKLCKILREIDATLYMLDDMLHEQENVTGPPIVVVCKSFGLGTVLDMSMGL